jgi:hypothetical protein
VAKSNHFVQDASKRPNIRLLVVRLLLADLWRQVIRSSYSCLSAIIGVLQNTSNTKVTNLDRPILVHEDVLSLQISVQNFPVVNMLNSESHLNKPVENLVFTVTDFANFLLVGDLSVEVSSVCIVHDDAETALVHK